MKVARLSGITAFVLLDASFFVALALIWTPGSFAAQLAQTASLFFWSAVVAAFVALLAAIAASE